MQFSELGLNAKLLTALNTVGYPTATAVQAHAIPAALKGGDLLVSASTGSGKTAAFLLPCLQRILESNSLLNATRPSNSGPKVLVLAPTRELALQVAKAAQTYGREIKRLRVATVVGGVPYGLQIKALSSPLDILIATPGRLLDLMNMRKANLSNIQTLVLDEADRMLDMGFIEDIETIASAIPSNRQTLMFSATFDGQAGQLAKKLTRDAQRIEVNSQTEKHKNISQRLHWADTPKHKDALLDHLLADVNVQQAIVFTSTQRDAEKLAFRLEDIGHKVAALHGGMPQGKRNRTLQFLREGRVRVLIATDVAARGIDVPTISHVINYGMPMNPEDYVHRIGRTGRAGRDGFAITLAQPDDNSMIRRIERLTTQRIPNEVIVGLEPKLGTPSERPSRSHSRSFAGKPGGSRSAVGSGGGARNYQNRSDSPKQKIAHKSSERNFQTQRNTTDAANRLTLGSFGGSNNSLQAPREQHYSKASENRPISSKRSGGFNSSGKTGGKIFSTKLSSRNARGAGFVL
ncbi:MAG: DEAD/DEAH box helicase [Burkholderiaceae bacterium]|nr:DEAD/DEAH box helicase [Burkholderiaceae bacterium]